MNWIPTSERLPKEDGYYLVQFKNPRVMKVLQYSPSQYYLPWAEFCSTHYSTKAITAWMPLPEPYKGEKK